MNDPAALPSGGTLPPEPPPARPPRHRRLLAGAVLVAAAAVALLLLWRLRPAPRPADPFPLPPLTTSPYRNTGPGAHYVGSDACRSCHEEASASFRRTGMGRSMAVVDPAREPA